VGGFFGLFSFVPWQYLTDDMIARHADMWHHVSPFCTSRDLVVQTKAMRAACGEAHLKTILATGELATMTNVYKASLVCMMAGADFIKVRS
jgi:deoxyribose-phosphate aldolase